MDQMQLDSGLNLLDLAGGHQLGAGPRIALTGPNQLGHRFIYPPTFSWQPVATADRYRITLAQGNRILHQVETDRAEVNLADAWSRVEPGLCRWVIQALGAEGSMIAHSNVFSFTRAGGFDGSVSPARHSNAETARRNLDFLLSNKGVGNHDPALPPYIWHCVIENDTDSVATPRLNRAFPAIHLPAAVDAFLDYRRSTTDASLQQTCLDRARQVADWVIAHSTPATDRYPYLPYQCVSQGRVGLHGGKPVDSPDQAHENLVEPNKCGYMGLAYLRLYEETADVRYAEAAERIAETLRATQLPGGNWLYRVHATTGDAQGEVYTSTVIFAVAFMVAMDDLHPAGPYREAKHASLSWLLDNPLSTFRWENMFDDTTYLPDYANTGNYDTLFAGRFLLAHQDQDPRYLPLAEAIFRWIDDNFTLYTADPWLSYLPYTPTVAEQWTYYWPMAGHTANWLLFLLPLSEATGREDIRQRAIGAANVLTQCMMADGRTTTYVPDATLGARAQGRTDDWFGDTFWSVSALVAMMEQS